MNAPSISATSEQDTSLIREALTELSLRSPEHVESTSVEVKGWCKDAKELFEKMSDSCSCLANGEGGIVFLGVKETSDPTDRFSRCPWRSVNPDLLLLKLCELTHPPVACRAYDASPILREIIGTTDANVFALVVPKTTSINGHMTMKGVSKIRVGKECKPNFTVEDDYTRRIVPGLTVDSLSTSSLNWALSAHESAYKVPRSAWESHTDFLLQAGLIRKLHRPEGQPLYVVTMAAALLFGTEATISQHLSYCETVLRTPSGSRPIRKNIVDSFRELCETKNGVIPSLCPGIGLATAKELIMNGYIHRCYRVPSGIVITANEAEFTVQNPGELAASLRANSLIYCIPVYRNLLLAEGSRYLGLCDKVGQGIDIIYKAVLSEGFDFPHFASEDGSFLASVPLNGSANFREFVRKRSQALTSLDEIAVIRTLYSSGECSFQELASCMQRSAERALNVPKEMVSKLMIVPMGTDKFALCATVRQDVDDIFSSAQMVFAMDLYGEG